MTDAEHTRPTERLWTPWRMNYVGGGTSEPGCIFCNRLDRTNDIESLILFRGQHSFVIMNLYPYNTGHIMLVPNQHASDLAQLSPETLAEMGTTLPSLTNALRRAFNCHGFNIGLNIGAIAGAGVEAHLHQHIVPRWQGDANFMPILASTMTIPELIPVTYAKIRAELAREMSGAASARWVMLSEAGDRVLLHENAIPSVDIAGDMPILQAMTSSSPDGITDVQLAGWAGPSQASPVIPDDIILTFIATIQDDLPAPWTSMPVDDPSLPDEARRIVQRAMSQRAPIQ